MTFLTHSSRHRLISLQIRNIDICHPQLTSQPHFPVNMKKLHVSPAAHDPISVASRYGILIFITHSLRPPSQFPADMGY